MQFGGVQLSDAGGRQAHRRGGPAADDARRRHRRRFAAGKEPAHSRFDSCRDNPLAEELKRSISRTRAVGIGRGLAKIDSPQGMIVAYATQAGRTADDGLGRNSPYTAAFLKHFETQEEIATVFRRISGDVYEATRRQQLPELSLSVIGEFYLRGKPQIAAQPAAPLAPQPDPAALEIAFWRLDQGHQEPAPVRGLSQSVPERHVRRHRENHARSDQRSPRSSQWPRSPTKRPRSAIQACCANCATGSTSSISTPARPTDRSANPRARPSANSRPPTSWR